MSGYRLKFFRFFSYFLGLASFLLIWQILSLMFTATVVPSPMKVLYRVWQLIFDRSIYSHLFISVGRAFAGFFLALLVGSVLGILSGLVRFFEDYFQFGIVFLQGTPVFLWVIPLTIMFYKMEIAVIGVVFFIILPLVITQVMNGVRSINKKYWDVFKIYSKGYLVVLFELIIPKLFPFFKTIFFIGLILSFKVLIVAEWFSSAKGFGRLINQYYYTYDMLEFYSYSILFLLTIGFIIGILHFVLKKLDLRKRKISFFKKSDVVRDQFLNNDTAFDSFKRDCDKKYVVVLSNISFSYDNQTLLNNINLVVEPYKPVIIVGESGVGKTTLAKVASGLIKGYSGKVDKPEKSAILFQEDLLLDHRNVYDNAKFYYIYKHSYEIHDCVTGILQRSGLSGSYGLYPDEMSSGMKKRLAFARALVYSPDFMILDEPFVNLHKEARSSMWQLFDDLVISKGVPSLIITHHPEEIPFDNTKVYTLESGSLILH